MRFVKLNVLGPFQLSVGTDANVPLSAQKSQALLCYIASHSGKPVLREKIAALLWSDVADEFARTNLRQCLAVTRKALKHDQQPTLVNQGQSVYLDTEHFSTDLQKFQEYLELGTARSNELALSLYRGEFLEGVSLDNCLFNDWLTVERRRHHETVVTLCHRLLAQLRESAGTADELRVAGRLLEIEPADESGHRSMMYCHHKFDRRSLALRQYETCKSLLSKELGAEPSAATNALFQEILSQDPGTSEATELTSNEITNSEFTNVSDFTNVKTESSSPAMVMKHWLLGSVVLVLIMTVIAMSAWFFKQKRSQQLIEKALETAITRSSALQPVIAVLPFKNLATEDRGDYFSDGLTEDLITDLSRISGLTVIARSSSFVYRDNEPNISKISTELGASVVLLGSVRRLDDRVRINTQLVDARDGTQLWADRYDRALSDVLAVQDEISQTIVDQLSVQLTETEQKRIDQIQLVNPDAYDLFLTSLRPIRELTRTGSAEARRILNQVIELDSDFARAWANLSLTYSQDLNFGFWEDRQQWIELGFEYAEKARQLDPALPQLYFTLSGLHLADNAHDKGIAAALRSIELDPNYADGYGTLAQLLLFSGDLENATVALTRAKQLNPRYTFTYIWLDGQIAFLSGNYNRSVELFTEINQRNPSFVNSRLMLISSYGHLDQIEDAEWEISELMIARPHFSIDNERETAAYLNPQHTERFIAGLRKAGL